MKPETLCLHACGFKDTVARGINTPIFTSSSFEYLDRPSTPYPRYFNTPNQTAVINKICALEKGADGLLFGSGMAAISTALFTLLHAGDHAVIQNQIYGGAHAFASDQFSAHHIESTFVDATPEAISLAIRPNTRLIYIESPTNPLLTLVDLASVAQIARKAGVLTVIDNTFATPILQNPISLGIDVVIHSGTKYFGGHSDLSCGAVIANKELIRAMRKTALSLGGCLNAQDCYLLERSLKTLALRVERQTHNAGIIAPWLARHPKIARVYYPGLENHPGHDIARRQMSGFGAIVSFDLDPARPVKDFFNKLKLIRPAVSLAGVESTICDPVSTSHAKVSAEVRCQMGISEHLVRLSVGIEHPDDLMTDLEQALA